jgi:hypothetical protein
MRSCKLFCPWLQPQKIINYCTLYPAWSFAWFLLSPSRKMPLICQWSFLLTFSNLLLQISESFTAVWSEILTASLNNLVIYKYLHYAFWHILTQNWFWNSGFYKTFGSFLDMGYFPLKHSASMSLTSMEPDHNWNHYTIIWLIEDNTGLWEWLKYLLI